MAAVTAWQEVARGIWARRYDPFDVNVTVISGAEGSVLVDTRTSLAEAAELRADLDELGAPPLVAVAITHHHLDHCLGTGAFGGLPVWGSEGCRTALRRGGIAQRERWLTWLPEDDRPHVRASPIVVPDHGVTDEARIDLGDRMVHLAVLGAGHTDHDLVIHVPDAKTLVAGDLVEVGAPPSFEDADPFSWPVTLGRLESLGARVVVPGHGAVTDHLHLAGQREELAHLAALCREAVGGIRSHASVVAASPFDEDTTRVALDRAAVTA